ncbi:hypothetical protein ASPZODRAFT_76834, partial [Penicilliopsis zonata CBS 506.65]
VLSKLPTVDAAAFDSHADEYTADPAIVNKNLREQFTQLILKPLEAVDSGGYQKTIVLVLDALDECDNDNEIKLIIHLISLAKSLTSVRLRAFVTSRPEVPVRLGFHAIQGKYEHLILEEIPAPVIEQDIQVFLQDELANIKEEHNSQARIEDRLPQDWPGIRITRDLVQMAVPLFIFAATVCRFIADPVWSDPSGQLEKILECREMGRLEATYNPILAQLRASSNADQTALVAEFRTIVGSIVLLAEPLSATSLSLILDIPRSIRCQKDSCPAGKTLSQGHACLYWVYHVEQSGEHLIDGHEVDIFLKTHFLHWLEALSLLGRMTESMRMINTLQGLLVKIIVLTVSPDQHPLPSLSLLI